MKHPVVNINNKAIKFTNLRKGKKNQNPSDCNKKLLYPRINYQFGTGARSELQSLNFIF